MKKPWWFLLAAICIVAMWVYSDLHQERSQPPTSSIPVMQLPLPARPDTFPVTDRILVNTKTGSLLTTFPVRHDDLMPWLDVPGVQLYARRVDARLDDYKMMLQKLRHSHRGLRIDLIGQLHLDERNSGYENAKAADVQMRIASFVQRLKPDIVAAEGFSGDTLSDPNYVCMLSAFGRVMSPDREPDEQAMLANMPNQHRTDFSLRLLDISPELRIVGAEDSDLHALNQLVQMTPGGDQAPINQRIVEARSLIALSRLITTMEHEHRKYGVLVMGYMHEPELVRWQRALGIPGTVYTATE